MTPQDFIQKWGPGGPAFHLNEEQGAQSHFLDLCELLAVPKPGSEAGYLFEEKNSLIGGRTGYADVFRRGAFAWENKAPGKSLDSALKQLLTYSLALSNPPILVVCDRLTIRIHTQFTGHPTETHQVLLAELDQPDKRALLRRIWLDTESFRPQKTSRDITEAAARSFATLADGLRKRGPAKEQDAQGWQAHADEVAHFLHAMPVLLFCRGSSPTRCWSRSTISSAAMRCWRFSPTPGPNSLPHWERAGVRAPRFRLRQAGPKRTGALVPAGLSESNVPLVQQARAQAAIKTIAARTHAERIARAAKRLNDLREAWLNPPEWTMRVPEVVPLGMDTSPYPDRILPRNGHEKELAERTLTKLYNQRPAWLDAAHKTLDLAVAAAYGWADYGADMADEEILKRLLALNLQRSGQG